MLVNKYLSSTALFNVPGEQSGAAGGADPAAADPAVAAAADPAAAGADPAAAPAVDPAADPAASGQEPARPHGNAGRQPWYMARINEETNRRHAEASRAAQAEQRARDAEEMLSRLQRGEQPPAGQQQQPAAQPQRGAQPNNEDELNRVIHQTARAISTAERLQEDSTAVMLKGGADFADWTDTVNTLKAIGVTSDEIVGDVIAVDKANAHVIFDQLAKDPEKAVLLTNMNPRQRIVEITRMSSAISPGAARAAAAAAPANNSPAAAVANARRISNAPAPPPPAAPAGASQKTWDSDEVSDEEFSKGWNTKYAKA